MVQLATWTPQRVNIKYSNNSVDLWDTFHSCGKTSTQHYSDMLLEGKVRRNYQKSDRYLTPLTLFFSLICWIMKGKTRVIITTKKSTKLGRWSNRRHFPLNSNLVRTNETVLQPYPQGQNQWRIQVCHSTIPHNVAKYLKNDRNPQAYNLPPWVCIFVFGLTLAWQLSKEVRNFI